jgi:predicted lipid-binding transport protein (Tim44 family)
MAGLAVSMAVAPSEAEAKRLGGSRSSGMQRDTPNQPMQKAPDATPSPTQAAPAAVPGAAAAATKAAPAATAKRSWTGPLMGLAAGLGLAALFSSLGMGEGFASVMMMLLIGLVAFAVIRFVMARMRGGNAGQAGGLAMAGAGAGAAAANARATTSPQPMARQGVDASGVQIGTALQPPMAVPGLNDGELRQAATATARTLPAGFDGAAFERIAKTIFIRLQTANDERNLDDLRAFTTPQMFAEVQADILDRGTATQRTEVVSVNPTIVDFAEEGLDQIVSVRFVGVIRETADGPSESFDEVWHLVKTADGGNAWRIAGIQQVA